MDWLDCRFVIESMCIWHWLTCCDLKKSWMTFIESCSDLSAQIAAKGMRTWSFFIWQRDPKQCPSSASFVCFFGGNTHFRLHFSSKKEFPIFSLSREWICRGGTKDRRIWQSSAWWLESFWKEDISSHPVFFSSSSAQVTSGPWIKVWWPLY